MQRPWLLFGGIIVLLVGFAGLILPVIPGIALIVLGGLMIRSSVTGEPVNLANLRRSRRDPIPEAAES